MKITKEHIGKKVRGEKWEESDYITVDAVNSLAFLCHHEDGRDNYYSSHDGWELYEELNYDIMSPAIVKIDSDVCISELLFKTEQEAQDYYYWSSDFISWPALDANGNPVQYRVPKK